MDEDERASSTDSDADYAPEDDPEGEEEDREFDEEPNPEAEPEAEPEPEARYTPPGYSVDPGVSEEQVQAIADQMGMTREQVVLMGQYIGHLVNRHTQAESLAQWQMRQAAAAAPSFYDRYGPAIETHLRRVDPAHRANPRMVQSATWLAYVEAQPEGRSLSQLAEGFAREVSGNRAPARDSRPPQKPALPPERRTPGGSATGGRAAAPQRERRERRADGDEPTRGIAGLYPDLTEYGEDLRRAERSAKGWR